MPFFDFHLHPSLKPQMSLPPGFPSPWQKIHITFQHPDLMIKIMQCQGINEVVDSQASLGQLIQGEVNLITIALHPPESKMMADNLILKIARDQQTPFINEQRVVSIGTGDIYFTMLNQELSNLQTHLQDQGRKLKIIRNFAEYDPADLNTIHAVFSVEGPHAFWGQRSGRDPVVVTEEYWTQFDQFTAANKILSMNIAHLQDNDFCNHAYGIQIFKAKNFYPTGNGIKPLGYIMFDRMNSKGIMLDIKHMSLLARTQLYEYRQTHHDLPVVCTHAGLTGISRNDRRRYIISTGTSFGNTMIRNNKPGGYLTGTSFNANSINLYDEDVLEIWRSGGLVGLSMDQRILGVPADMMQGDDWPDEIYDEDSISPHEKAFFLSNEIEDNRIDEDWYLHEIRTTDKQNTPMFHARHFMNQVFHLFAIASNPANQINPAVASKLVCIGSDFDGLIDPMDCCKNSTELKSFKSLLLSKFDAWEREAFGAKKPISAIIAPQDLLDNIFYQNAVDFLRDNLS